jgi:hypothetical protein
VCLSPKLNKSHWIRGVKGQNSYISLFLGRRFAKVIGSSSQNSGLDLEFREICTAFSFFEMYLHIVSPSYTTFSTFNISILNLSFEFKFKFLKTLKQVF